MLVTGSSVADIARSLGVSSKTVANHQSILRHKLGAGSAIQLLQAAADKASLRVTGAQGARRFTIDIEVRSGERHVRYRVTEDLDAPTQSRTLQSRYRFAGDHVDFCWVPHLRPGADHVVGQFSFKSPVIITQYESRLAALVADVELIEAAAPHPV